MPFEVETRSLEEVQEIVALYDSGKASKVTRVMLDNMAHSDDSQPGRDSDSQFKVVCWFPQDLFP